MAVKKIRQVRLTRRTNEKIGEMLGKARAKTGKSSKEVGAEVGITGSAVRSIELGICGATPETLEAMALAAGLTRARTDKLHAMAGHVRPAVHATLVACPERWDEVLVLLTQGKLASTDMEFPRCENCQGRPMIKPTHAVVFPPPDKSTK